MFAKGTGSETAVHSLSQTQFRRITILWKHTSIFQAKLLPCYMKLKTFKYIWRVSCTGSAWNWGQYFKCEAVHTRCWKVQRWITFCAFPHNFFVNCTGDISIEGPSKSRSWFSNCIVSGIHYNSINLISRLLNDQFLFKHDYSLF